MVRSSWRFQKISPDCGYFVLHKEYQFKNFETFCFKMKLNYDQKGGFSSYQIFSSKLQTDDDILWNRHLLIGKTREVPSEEAIAIFNLYWNACIQGKNWESLRFKKLRPDTLNVLN